MASLTLTIGPVTSTYEFKKENGTLRTNTEMSQIIEWFITEYPPEGTMPEGLTVAQQNQWKLDAAVSKLVRYMRREVIRIRRLQSESTVVQQAQTEAEL